MEETLPNWEVCPPPRCGPQTKCSIRGFVNATVAITAVKFCILIVEAMLWQRSVCVWGRLYAIPQLEFEIWPPHWLLSWKFTAPVTSVTVKSRFNAQHTSTRCNYYSQPRIFPDWQTRGRDSRRTHVTGAVIAGNRTRRSQSSRALYSIEPDSTKLTLK